MTKLSPIAIFVYNRHDHFVKTIKYLKKNHLSNKSQIYIFSDGSKKNSDKKHVKKIRNYCKKIKGFKSIKTFERKTNFGLSRNLVDGISKILKKHQSVIVLEDDLLTDKFFLKYMNDSLNYYLKNKKVISIHAYLYPIKNIIKKPFFLKGADCWGWGTWRRGWKLYNSNSKSLLKSLKTKKKEKEFNFNNTFEYSKMLRDNINKKNDSWAIKWYASAFLKNKLTLYPPYSLIKNIGNDGSGTNSKSDRKYDVTLKNKKINIKNLQIKEDVRVKKYIENFFYSNLNFIKKVYRIFF